ncbi:MAG: tRNA dihydrouridine synthase DusB [Bacteroidales bacterium]|nr:tRNA dihydrouridine synthase DusB [Bacteroidales bacterium]
MKIGKYNIKNPVFLAPMEDVTDMPFRQLCKSFGADVLVTEFVSSDALIRHVKNNIEKMAFAEQERPIGIQIYGHDIPTMIEAAKIVETRNPDFIDLNFGCPVKKVVRRGAGAGMLQDIPKMIDMTSQVVKAVSIPVSVKTRIGWDDKTVDLIEMVKKLQDTGIQFLTLHFRTRQQMYTGKADWTWMEKIDKESSITIPIIGNGDISGAENASEKFANYNVSGIMLGRAAIGNPWVFKSVETYLNENRLLPQPTLVEKVAIATKQLENNVAYYGERIGVKLMRRHFVQYFKGLTNFRQTKIKLLRSDDFEGNKEILKLIAENFS